jgi:Flp pilus assembly protein TadD
MTYCKDYRKSSLAVLLLTSALALSACQSKMASLEGADSITTGSTDPGSFTKTAELGKKWNADQKDLKLGVAYADSLEKLGQVDQQFEVLRTISQNNPDNAKFQIHFAKKLLSSGQSEEAVKVLEKMASNTNDWKILSALGSAYDQQGEHVSARMSYEKALALQPKEISVLNNLGMSYALEGNLKQAESTLRQALALPESKALPRIRQNLALVIGLQGRFEESREIASKDLPPAQVEENMAYLQKMLSQPNTWQQLSEK